MIGLMQIMIYLGCFYLVYKGVEIFQLGYFTEDKKKRDVGLIVGTVAIVFACIVAFVAVYLTQGIINEIEFKQEVMEYELQKLRRGY